MRDFSSICSARSNGLWSGKRNSELLQLSFEAVRRVERVDVSTIAPTVADDPTTIQFCDNHRVARRVGVKFGDSEIGPDQLVQRQRRCTL